MKSQTALPPQKNGVKIGKDIIAVSSLNEAVERWEAHRDFNNLGASESPNVTACVEGRLFRISYNGRCWNPSTGKEVSRYTGTE
jgi:hypothetical protein